MTVVAIHQPNYLPWLGYFCKAKIADVFVLLDDVQFTKQESTQRTKIRTQRGWMWLTIPITKENHFKRICDITLPQDERWQRKHQTSIIANYSKCKHYDANFVNGYYTKAFKGLQEFNEHGLLYLMEKFALAPEIVYASELGLDDNVKGTDRIVAIIKATGGDTYVSGTGGKRYLNERAFKRDNIKLRYFVLGDIAYHQRWLGYEPYMSATDLLFNVGEDEARKVLLSAAALHTPQSRA